MTLGTWWLLVLVVITLKGNNIFIATIEGPRRYAVYLIILA